MKLETGIGLIKVSQIMIRNAYQHVKGFKKLNGVVIDLWHGCWSLLVILVKMAILVDLCSKLVKWNRLWHALLYANLGGCIVFSVLLSLISEVRKLLTDD